MNQLTNTDLHFVVSRLPKDVIKLVSDNSLIIAGGFIRETISGGKVSDIDMFGSSPDALAFAALTIGQERKGRLIKTDNATTVLSPPRIPLQFIKRWLFDTPEECVKSFDFTVCQAAIWFKEEKWHSSISEQFYPDLAARRLIYTYPIRDEEPGGSMMRMIKFLKRGYIIQSSSVAGVVSRLVGKIDHDINDEKRRAKVITGLLRNVDPLTVVDGVELVDEHEVKI